MRSLNPWPIFPSNLDPPFARSLSIQFILQALLDSFELLDKLKTAPYFQLKGVDLKKEVNLISKELKKFLLFSLENPFAQRCSFLDKLCFYCEILLQASHIRESEILLVLEDMRNDVLSVKAKMISWKKGLVPIAEIEAQLFTLYKALMQKLGRFFKALSPFLKEARSDENVLIYLIEQKDRFNAHLGPHCIEELLQSFFPTGHAQLRAAIYEGYTRRGFSAFLSSVEPLIDAIEWDTPCHSPTKV